MFTFGDPESVLDRRDLLNYLECWKNGKWYEPPVNLGGLARTLHAGPHHSSALAVKRNMLVKSFIPSPKLSRADFEAAVWDYLVLANLYLERRKSIGGRTLRLVHSPALYMRRGIDLNRYFFCPSGVRNPHEFDAGAVLHIYQRDLRQEVYGFPEYWGGLNSLLLNEASTLFRRKYYKNGSHAGFILYMTDPAQNEDDVTSLRKALRESKGPGNFRNLFMYAPNGKKDGLQLIPISQAAASDEFLNIKNVSAEDVLAVHRVPPVLLGMVPKNAGGFGKPSEAADTFHSMEIEALQMKMLELNEQLGEEVIRFRPYEKIGAPANDNSGKAAA